MDILMLIAGIWFMISGRMPSWVIGGGKYRIEGNGVRIIGLLFTLPVALTFFATWILGISGFSIFLLEAILLIVVVIVSVIVARRIRVPISSLETNKTGEET